MRLPSCRFVLLRRAMLPCCFMIWCHAELLCVTWNAAVVCASVVPSCGASMCVVRFCCGVMWCCRIVLCYCVVRCYCVCVLSVCVLSVCVCAVLLCCRAFLFCRRVVPSCRFVLVCGAVMPCRALVPCQCVSCRVFRCAVLRCCCVVSCCRVVRCRCAVLCRHGVFSCRVVLCCAVVIPAVLVCLVLLLTAFRIFAAVTERPDPWPFLVNIFFYQAAHLCSPLPMKAKLHKFWGFCFLPVNQILGGSTCKFGPVFVPPMPMAHPTTPEFFWEHACNDSCGVVLLSSELCVAGIRQPHRHGLRWLSVPPCSSVLGRGSAVP